jgi:primosomal protein N' (replication factor Y) (superfamily II helicase)
MNTALSTCLEEGMSLVEVCIPPLPRPYSYLMPHDFFQPQFGFVGSRVIVPLGSKRVEGYITRVQDLKELSGDYKTKSVVRDTSTHSAFTQEALQLYNWIADYYHYPLSQVLEIAIPAFSKPKNSAIVSLKPDSNEGSLKGEKQKLIVAALKQHGGSIKQTELTRQFRNSSATIRSLIEKEIIELVTTAEQDTILKPITSPSWAHRNVTLDEQQNHALESITSTFTTNHHRTFLLHGVTGSGKTEVYIEAIRRVRELGKTALVIVPEIALTPQLTDRFAARFSEPIAVLHSGINKKNRWQAWQAAMEGKANIVIGARSAIFCPIANLGIIIVDEEHDPSFKQQDGLRYNARDLAVVRGSFSSCPVVLGSATPSLESYHNAEKSRYTLLTLGKRHESGSSLQIECVDMSRKRPWEMPSRSVSPELKSAITETLDKKGQTFILYNRRGFASYLQCTRCEYVLTCPHCDLAFTYHRKKHTLLCHYCSATLRPPAGCKECSAMPSEKPASGEDLPEASVFAERGAGTERIFEELQVLFPDASIDRLDRDSATSIDDYQRILSKVRDGTTDILVGTQLIAKGHDLPNVLLVGVVDCDIGIHIPDFRAGERVFQLLNQVSGRAGRGSKSGRVILQTRVPHHASIQAALTGSFEQFARTELTQRQRFRYPPFSRLLRITSQSEENGQALQALAEVKVILDALVAKNELSIGILGPTPAPMAKLRNKWRAQLLVKSDKVSELQKTMAVIRANIKRDKKCPVLLDIDPLEML